jgi:trehalose synthase
MKEAIDKSGNDHVHAHVPHVPHVPPVRASKLWACFAACLIACGTGASARPADKPPTAADAANQLAQDYAKHAMLQQADETFTAISGSRLPWSGPYLTPQPETLTREAADYLTLYPRAYLPSSGESVLGTLAQPKLWDALSQVGFTLVHPLTFERSGRVLGRSVSPSIDGGFDRISYEVEPELGSEDDLRKLVAAARAHGAMVVGDVVPLHSGLGYDFRLAEMGVQPYPGMYEMIEIPQKDWGLLPQVDDPWGVKVVTLERAPALKRAGHLPGRVDVLVGSEESVRWSGWAATGPVVGVDGRARRFIYVHLFEAEQPKYNWIDPSYAGRRSQVGDVAHQIVQRGIRMVRLDAVPFLGLELQRDSDHFKHYMTSLAIAGTDDLAYTARRLGGWTWVELNVPVESYAQFMQHGADLGYDFFTRAETLHPLITSDARILSLAHRALLEAGIRHGGLIHSLQNHDEITYQQVSLRGLARVQYGDETLSGKQLADRVLAQAQKAVAGDAAPYNLLYRPERDGIATTYAGFIAAALGVDPYHATSEQAAAIKRAHVMLAHMTAMQPGVFSLSQWDLVGALPLDRSEVQKRLAGGDGRWVNRGSVDLMGQGATSTGEDGLPQARALYGTLPQQLQDPQSFASQIGRMIRARKTYRIAEATVVDVPNVSDSAVCALVMTLPAELGGVAVTAVNYGRTDTRIKIRLNAAAAAEKLTGEPHDVITDAASGSFDSKGKVLELALPGHAGRTVVLGARSRSEAAKQE